MRRHPVGAFLLWFFTVGQAIAFVPVLAAADGTDLPRQPFVVASTLIGLLLPALLLTWLLDGRTAVRQLVRSSLAWRRSAGWYLAALVAVPALAFALTAVVVGVPDVSAEEALAAVVAGFLLQLVLTTLPNNLWEEVAWTGFVQERLQRRRSAAAAALAVGPLFALQHVSLVAGGSPQQGVVLMGLLVVLAIPFRFLLGWVWNRTGSLFLVGLLHGAGNAAASGSGFGEGLLPRLYPGSGLATSAHLLVFLVLGLAVLLGTRGRLGTARGDLGRAPRQRTTTSPGRTS